MRVKYGIYGRIFKDVLVLHTILFLILFWSLGSLYGYEGQPVSLFDHVIHKSYETMQDGTDSYVLEILGLKNFYNEIATSKKPVIVKFFVQNTVNDLGSKYLFQNYATTFRDKVRFASVNIATNKAMMKQFVGFFVKLALDLQSKGKEGFVMVARIMELLKRIVALEQSPESVPFVLFFKDGDLVFPQSFDFAKESLFVSSLENFLLKPETQSAVRFLNTNEQKKERFWKKVKRKIKNWWRKS